VDAQHLLEELRTALQCSEGTGAQAGRAIEQQHGAAHKLWEALQREVGLLAKSTEPKLPG